MTTTATALLSAGSTRLPLSPGTDGADVGRFKEDFLSNLLCRQGRSALELATTNDCYMALAYTVRDRMLSHWSRTAERYSRRDFRVVSYLSAEYLLGPHLGNNLINLGLWGVADAAMRKLGLDLGVLIAQEEEPGLGNGGLGRLAACYLDSLASLEVPAIGYGIRYEYGIFDQEIRDGWQAEIADQWLRFGNPWEIERPELAFEVKFGGRTEAFRDAQGRYRVNWIAERRVKGVAYDTPIQGYGVDTCNLLRLWRAKSTCSFDFQAFNVGDYYDAVRDAVTSENITQVLYPNDEAPQGKRLRLEQQYFFVTCALQDMIRLCRLSARPLRELHRMFAIQLNDTHPAIGVAELMRLLVDEHGLTWEEAWEVTCGAFGYTNHTLLPEALEKWPLPLFGSLLPRHLEIIFEINRRFLDEVGARFGEGDPRIARLSLIDETGPRYVRMAHLAAVGSRRINGVARLHSELLQKTVMRDFHELWPQKFRNVTNGVTPRRFLVLSNPGLADLIQERLGNGWVRDLEALRGLEPLANDAGFRDAWHRVKEANKRRLAQVLRERTGVVVDPESLFDVQAKRIHEYKRQHLNILHVIALYLRLKANPGLNEAPRAFVFAGKAAPGYFMARRIIKLIHGVAEVVNGDAAMRGRLAVAFLPDFNVTNAQFVYPAADLSEQISTAGMEASGTGNMKFALNGALTIGTLDGANVEIREQVGPENFFLFGMTVADVERLRAQGYRPGDVAESDPELRSALRALADGQFSRGDREVFRPIVDNLLYSDPFLVLADFRAYVACQAQVSEAFRDRMRWTRLSILNSARVGWFSSDRSIAEYCREIWEVPTGVSLSEEGQ